MLLPDAVGLLAAGFRMLLKKLNAAERGFEVVAGAAVVAAAVVVAADVVVAGAGVVVAVSLPACLF